MKKIITIVGARPQFVKAAIVSRAIKKYSHIQEYILHTGQHYDSNMSEIFFDELEMSQITFQLTSQSKTHATQTSEMLIGIEKILISEQPDWLLIYGDTNSTLAGALAAAKLNIPIAHVEAGLRSFNRCMPEEINRLVADQLAAILFAPTETAFNNLIKEGYSSEKIKTVGDVMYDAALFYGDKATRQSSHAEELQDYILATIHRAENTNDPVKLFNIFEALEKLTHLIPVLMPLHPRTKHVMHQYYPDLLNKTAIKIIEPVGFLEMIRLEKNAKLIMTDSGGVQKEAFFYQIPCVTLREETEWVETIDLKWNNLVSPTNAEIIFQVAQAMLKQKGIAGKFPFGKGDASEQIANYLSEN